MAPKQLVFLPQNPIGMGAIEVAVGGGVSYAYLKGTSGEKIVVEERGEIRSTEGDTVGLILDAASARLFDAASETRIR